MTLQGIQESALLMSPAEIPFSGDAVSWQVAGTPCAMVAAAPEAFKTTHNDTGNTGFLDGHVKALPATVFHQMARDSYNNVAGKVWR